MATTDVSAVFNFETEKRIRREVNLGEPWPLEELTAEICGSDAKRAAEFSGIVADEYLSRLSAMPRIEMKDLYRHCYKEPNDADKDWPLGEIVESIQAGEN